MQDVHVFLTIHTKTLDENRFIAILGHQPVFNTAQTPPLLLHSDAFCLTLTY
jgi:hypothetical protein